MKYYLWSDENIADIRKMYKNADTSTKKFLEETIGLLIEANKRHEVEMLKKDVEISELKGSLKTFQYIANGRSEI